MPDSPAPTMTTSTESVGRYALAAPCIWEGSPLEPIAFLYLALCLVSLGLNRTRSQRLPAYSSSNDCPPTMRGRHPRRGWNDRYGSVIGEVVNQLFLLLDSAL